MKNYFSKILVAFSVIFVSLNLWAQAKVMNPGEAYGQLVYISADDVLSKSAKMSSLSAYSIPVLAELPMELSVIAGAITLKQQNLSSHVQLKSRARKTPNLDISGLKDGMNDPLFKGLKDGDWIHMVLSPNGDILIEPATEKQAIEFFNQRKTEPVTLKADLQTKTIFRHADLGWQDFDKVGSKAANYAELIRALNIPGRDVVRPGYAIPFFYYEEFISSNPKIQTAITKILKDPLMKNIAKVSYREAKLKALQDLMVAEDAIVSEKLIEDLIQIFDQVRFDGLVRNMKMRSSTNSEDLPNFNGAGLYTSASYKAKKKNKEKSLEDKKKSLREALQIVWSSVWNLRAFDERTFFQIPHAEVKMGIQVNPSFQDEGVDGVVVTKNIVGDSRFPGPGVYIEAQRGDKHSVANPLPGVSPEKILVLIDESAPLDTSRYQVKTLESSNIADDLESVLPTANPKPIMTEDEVKDLVFQSLKAREHFRPLLGDNKKDFALDLEFKVDSQDTGSRQVYIKQARPYID